MGDSTRVDPVNVERPRAKSEHLRHGKFSSRTMGKPAVEILRPDDSFEEWDPFVDTSPQASLFCRSWWLKAVCQDALEVLVLTKGGKIVAGMPYRRSKRYGLSFVHMPQMTQTLGVLLAPPEAASYEKRFSADMETIRDLVAAIPDVDYFHAAFHYNFTNWLPFYWAGYKQTTYYTYVIEDLSEPIRVIAEFASNKRTDIKKAENLVEVRQDLSAEQFYAHHKMTLGKKGARISYSWDLLNRIDSAARAHNAVKTWYAIDAQQRTHAAIYVVFDASSAYYLINSIDPDLGNSAAASLLVKHAIYGLSGLTRNFDFEGSMMESVGNSYRKFGGKQKPYFRITRDRLPAVVRWLRERRSK